MTFDTGGISLKPPANMDKMRGDMGGAACTVAAILSAAKLKLDIHLKGKFPFFHVFSSFFSVIIFFFQNLICPFISAFSIFQISSLFS